MRTSILRAGLLVSISMLGEPVAMAQSTGATVPAGMNLSPVTAGPMTQLQRFASSQADLLFTGERQKRTLVFVAQPEQLGGATNLVLGLQSAISDNPDASRLQIALNGRDLGTVQLRAGAPYAVSMAVPPGVIQPGYNAVTIAADQSHRVDCSIQATYELWTRIDPQLSGLQYTSATPPQASFLNVLAAVRSDDGRTSVNAVVTDGDSNALLGALQALAIAGGLDRPDVTLGSGLGTGPGLDLIVGPMQKVTALLGGKVDGAVHNGINFLRSAAGRPVVALVGEDPSDLQRQVADLAHYGTDGNAGTSQGLAAVASRRGAPLTANARVSFADLGIDDVCFSGRLYRQSTQFRMPADFYPADYARASIHLDAEYAQGLALGAQLLVKLNDKTVATLLLSGGRAGEIKDQILPISMMAFRPGLNNLTIEASLPAPQDATCDPAHISDGGGRLRIAGTSYLELPDIARVGRFPAVGALEASIAGKSSKGLDVVVNSSDADARNAAATFVAKLAYSSGRVTDVHEIADVQYGSGTPVVAIGAHESKPANKLAQARISPTSSAIDDQPAFVDATSTTPSWDAQWRDRAGQLVTEAQMHSVQIGKDTGLVFVLFVVLLWVDLHVLLVVS